MSLDTGAIIDAIVSYALASGYFERVNAHEPKSAPSTQGLTAAVWWGQTTPAPRGSGLAKTTARIEINMRIYLSMLTEPQDDIDRRITDATDALIVAYSGDFDLGIAGREIDLLGRSGVAMHARAGYVEQDRKMYRRGDHVDQDKKVYRTATLLIPIIAYDVWTQVR